MSRQQRLVFAGIAVVIAVVAVIVLAGGEDSGTTRTTGTVDTATGPTETPDAATTPDDETTPEPTPEPTPEVPVIRVQGGEVVGGEAEIEANRGDRVRFTVRSDVADHVHVHGYDVIRDVAAGAATTISFEARIVGVFEVELEESHLPLAQITVNP